ncbi:hypothetical protein [Chryseobacterium sp.]|uniref:hypothetical protein n=1 Tax=Chryseobacterium sp. TaxID=1871047 RepID=UPI00289B74FE|nr:hypothetical protein [Chryseobacterium sp.]
MPKNYNQLTESVRNRINPEHKALTKTFSDELSTISYSDVLVFIRTAMKGVEPEYTQKSKDAGERVKDHLLKGLSQVSFRYQGSVMTNTHIKAYSDIDLLTISEKFYQVDNYTVRQILENTEKRIKYFSSSIDKMEKEINVSSYQGNALEDLRYNRLKSEEILSDVYSICDIVKPKSIKIKNLSLNREVDIVIANWYDDVTSIINDKGEYRGIQIYNKEKHQRENTDYPFLSIKRINDRGTETNGRLKKMIRFIKNIKALSYNEIKLSSFDINAICYDIEVLKYQNLSFYELVPILYLQIKSICENKSHSDNIISVDGREYIFRYNSDKLENLKLILNEIQSIFVDLHINVLSK